LSGAPTEKQAPVRLQITPSLNGSTRTSLSPVGHGGVRGVGLGHNVPPDKNSLAGGNLGRNHEGAIHPLAPLTMPDWKGPYSIIFEYPYYGKCGKNGVSHGDHAD